MDPKLRDAIDAVDRGDAAALGAMLEADPELARARVPADEDEPYAGYFARATLLHHVAGNPIREPMPPNAAEVARLLLAHGAEVDAGCGGGPKQPDTGGTTTLGLVASSSAAAESGQAGALIDVLVEAGADVDHGEGEVLYLALYHTVECRAQREVAELVHARGARVDLGFAAALGRTDLVAEFLLADGTLAEGAYGRFRRDRMMDPSDQAVLDEALVLACMNGRAATVAQLLDAGADVDGRATVAGWSITPLHGAAWAGWAELVPLLVDRGADVNARDDTHKSTPAGWASWCRREETLARLLEHEDAFDLPNAVEFGLTDRVKALLGDGDPNQAFAELAPGCLLRAAAAMGHVDLVRFLLERGADPRLATVDGHTALDFARMRGQTAVVELLEGARGETKS